MLSLQSESKNPKPFTGPVWSLPKIFKPIVSLQVIEILQIWQKHLVHYLIGYRFFSNVGVPLSGKMIKISAFKNHIDLNYW